MRGRFPTCSRSRRIFGDGQLRFAEVEIVFERAQDVVADAAFAAEGEGGFALGTEEFVDGGELAAMLRVRLLCRIKQRLSDAPAGSAILAISSGSVGEPEFGNDRGQGESLHNQRDGDDDEGEKDDQAALRERVSVG